MFTDVSTLAAGVDKAFFFIVLVSVVLLALITALMIYFVIKYRRSKNKAPEDIEGNTVLEIVWIVVPTILVLAMFYFGWIGFRAMREVPQDVMPVKVEARMWKWSFEYESGKKSDVLRIRIGRKIKVTMTSRDVLHSLYIPAFRVKEDVLPMRETYMWFISNRLGTYDLFCAEYCGEGHSSMGTKVIVMSEDEFEEWLHAEEKEEEGPLDGGALVKRHGCLACHSLDGSRKLGPTFKGIFGKARIVVTKGREQTVIADEVYLRQSILNPNQDVVNGFQPLMPSMEGVLSEEEVDAMISYLKGVE